MPSSISASLMSARSSARVVAAISLRGLKQRMGSRPQIERPGAPVGRIGAALDETGLFQTVDQTADSDRLDLEKLGQGALVHALLHIDFLEHLPLRAGQAGAANILLEPFAQHSPGIDQQQTDRMHVLVS